MSKRIRYDLGFLRDFCEKEGIELVGEYLEGKVNRESIITGKCLGENCDQDFQKTFRMLYRSGGYCKECTSKMTSQKLREKGEHTLHDLQQYVIKNNIILLEEYKEINRETEVRGRCLGENCNLEFKKSFRALKKIGGYCEKCSIKRGVEKSVKTSFENYGESSPMKSKEVREKAEKTCYIRFGCKNPLQNTEIRNKATRTVVEKYGVKNVSQSEEIKNKKEYTNMKKRGVKFSLQDPAIRKQIETTNEQKYRHKCSLHGVEQKQKTLKTWLEKYNTLHPFQNPLISEKASKNAYKGYDVELPSGNILHLQGYEIYCIEDLINEGYEEQDILTSRKDVPEIWYIYEYEQHRYFPDFWIPKNNLIIECKSTYTMERNFDKNIAKLDACKAQGYKIEIRIYSRKGEIVDIYD